MPRRGSWALLPAVCACVAVATIGALTTRLDAAAAVGSTVGVLIGGVIGDVIRNRDYRRLSDTDKDLVDATVRSGVRSGAHHVDTVARRRLRDERRGFRLDRMLAPVAVVLIPALAIVAAIRHDNGWWLLTLVGPIAAVGFSRGRFVWPRDPRPALARLDHGVD